MFIYVFGYTRSLLWHIWYLRLQLLNEGPGSLTREFELGCPCWEHGVLASRPLERSPSFDSWLLPSSTLRSLWFYQAMRIIQDNFCVCWLDGILIPSTTSILFCQANLTKSQVLKISLWISLRGHYSAHHSSHSQVLWNSICWCLLTLWMFIGMNLKICHS